MASVTYVERSGAVHVVSVPVAQNLMQAAVYNGVPGIEGDCGGAAACATCHVYVPAEWRGRAGEPSKAELDMLECANDVTAESRLACQIVMTQDLDGLTLGLPETQR